MQSYRRTSVRKKRRDATYNSLKGCTREFESKLVRVTEIEEHKNK